MNFFYATDYGLVPGGPAADNSAALDQVTLAALDGNPNQQVAKGKGTIVLPAGKMEIDRPWKIKNCYGLQVIGTGECDLRCSNRTMSCMLDLDGVSYSKFENVSLVLGPNSSVDRVMQTSGVVRGSTKNRYTSIYVRAETDTSRFIVGIQNGKEGNQVDHSIWTDIKVVGRYEQDDYESPDDVPPYWQYGYIFGRGNHGNILLHEGYHISSHRCWTGFMNNVTETAIVGGAMDDCCWAYNNRGNYRFSVSDVRCEGAARLLTMGKAAGWSEWVSMRNVNFRTQQVAEDGMLVKVRGNGRLLLRGLQLSGDAPLHVWLNPGRKIALELRDISCPRELTDFVDMSTNGNHHVYGSCYVKSDPSGATIEDITGEFAF